MRDFTERVRLKQLSFGILHENGLPDSGMKTSRSYNLTKSLRSGSASSALCGITLTIYRKSDIIYSIML
ncbi:MAG: hypothetical protein MJ071_05665 [Oscillospiraceae bacterium]|nr:hypothetical protein [Oscillospiraceae bacterium]